MSDSEAIARAEYRVNSLPANKGCEKCERESCWADEVIECRGCHQQLNSCDCHMEMAIVPADYLKRLEDLAIREINISATPTHEEYRLLDDIEDRRKE
ncbi:MAG: hypothetical protein KGL39_14400 [Patescibacteria group bacterium]|nr:hypothetical protein [Patescibacteria group bacterium]